MLFFSVQIALPYSGELDRVYWRRERQRPIVQASELPPLGNLDSWREYLKGKLDARKRRKATGSPAQLSWWADELFAFDFVRPRTWGHCQSMGLGTDSPCPWYSCRYHLGLDDGAADGRRTEHLVVKVRIDPEDIEGRETCAMVLANRNRETGLQVAEVAELMGLSPGSIEAVERQAKWKISTVLGGVVKDWK